MAMKRFTHMCAKWHTWRDRAALWFIDAAVIVGIVVLFACAVRVKIIAGVKEVAEGRPMGTAENVCVINPSENIESLKF